MQIIVDWKRIVLPIPFYTLKVSNFSVDIKLTIDWPQCFKCNPASTPLIYLFDHASLTNTNNNNNTINHGKSNPDNVVL